MKYIKKFLLSENYLNNKKLFVESHFFNLYDLLLSETIDNELYDSLDIYAIEQRYYYLVNIDMMLQLAIEYRLYYNHYDFDNHRKYTRYEISELVINEIVRLYKILFITADVTILTRMLSSLDIIVESLYEILNDN